ncbi:uncharacterized protein LOC111872621 isoform X2 [Cryptotermes secundus]|uniref:uncharacterized protein LOC111872621 isoform X2 n=1 Tax=Cryptotermes secundus TaxID=105785 RepID=UPI000CD7AD02|nr:uncharacterized protein LOC111872621 isoform X2 [Cryptotermes secundus]
MGELQQGDIPWMDEGDEWGASEPSTLVMEVSEGMVLVGVIVGVSVVVILLFSLGLLIDCRTRKSGSQSSNSNAGKVSVSAKRTFPQFIRNSAQNNENITFVNEMCTENIATIPAASRSTENS